jgi:hypothetical protein
MKNFHSGYDEKEMKALEAAMLEKAKSISEARQEAGYCMHCHKKWKYAWEGKHYCKEHFLIPITKK